MKVPSKMKNVLKPVSDFASRTGRKLSVKSPKLLIVGGLATITAATIYACYKTPEAAEVIDSTKTALDDIDKKIEDKKEKKKEQITVVKDCGIGLTKIYIWPATMYGCGVFLVLSGCKLFDKRIAVLGTALVASQNNYNDIYERIKEKYGEEEAAIIKAGAKQIPVEKTVVDKVTGEQKKIQELVYKDTVKDDYAVLFDEHTAYKVWTNNPFTNMQHLQSSMMLCNEKLRKRGYLYLNEALDIFCIEAKSDIGHNHGWIYSDKTNLKGDHSVDHGVCIDARVNTSKYINFEGQRDFLNGFEPSVMLRFNCDGDISSEVARLNLY